MKPLIYIAFGFMLKWQATISTKICSKKDYDRYFIYSLNVNVQVYYCVIFSGAPNCEKLSLGTVAPHKSDIIKKCYKKLIESGFTKEQAQHLDLCQDTAKVNVIEDEIEFKSKEVYPYLEEYCKITRPRISLLYAFWESRDHCSDPKVMYDKRADVWTTEENDINNILLFNSSGGVSALKLVKNYSFCKTNIWKTNIKGTFASEIYLNGTIFNSTQLNLYQDQLQSFYNTIKSDCNRNEDSVFEADTSLVSISADEEIAKMKRQLLYLIVIVVICIFFMGIMATINTYVNYMSLRRASKTHRNKFYFLRCVSPSLMSRYLLLNETADVETDFEKPLELAATVNQQNLYEYIDIELHNNK